MKSQHKQVNDFLMSREEARKIVLAFAEESGKVLTEQEITYILDMSDISQVIQETKNAHKTGE